MSRTSWKTNVPFLAGVSAFQRLCPTITRFQTESIPVEVSVAASAEVRDARRVLIVGTFRKLAWVDQTLDDGHARRTPGALTVDTLFVDEPVIVAASAIVGFARCFGKRLALFPLAGINQTRDGVDAFRTEVGP